MHPHPRPPLCRPQGCMYRSDFKNTFFLNCLGPPALISIMIALRMLGLMTRHQVGTARLSWCGVVRCVLCIVAHTCCAVNALPSRAGSARQPPNVMPCCLAPH